MNAKGRAYLERACKPVDGREWAYASDVKELLAERDELLAALKKVTGPFFALTAEDFKAFGTLIARAEGKS